MEEWIRPAPDRRWHPFADALWACVGDWKPRCQAALDVVEQQLQDVVNPCALGVLLESAVPLQGDGWRDPLVPEFLRFTEWVCVCPWPDDEEGDDYADLSCFVGSCVIDGLSSSPEMSDLFLPYLGPHLVRGLEADIQLPSQRELWPEGLPSSSDIGARFTPLGLPPQPLLVTL